MSDAVSTEERAKSWWGTGEPDWDAGVCDGNPADPIRWFDPAKASGDGCSGCAKCSPRVVRWLNRLGLRATALDVKAHRRTPPQGIQHIRDTIERERRTPEWNALAQAALDRLDPAQEGKGK